MSQAELAAASGVSERTIRSFEAGDAEPRGDTLVLLQAALEARGIEFKNGERPTVTLDLAKAAARGTSP